MTTNERFLSVLHRITSCRHLATVNITIWNRRIEVRHTVFDEINSLHSLPYSVFPARIKIAEVRF